VSLMEYRPDRCALAKRDQSAMASLLQKKGPPCRRPLDNLYEQRISL
jgi:hypothetical protein